MRFCRVLPVSAAAALVAAGLGNGAAFAGEPKPWGLGFQEPASPFAERMFFFHDKILLTVTGVITLIVLGLLVYVMARFNERANPVPSRVTHNTKLEIIWTLVPVLILVGLSVPSFPLLYYGDVVPDSKYTVKVTGHQWYWSAEYETPDGETFSFDIFLLGDDEAEAAGLPRLLAVDEPMVVPMNVPVRFIVTSSDVLHAFAVPAFGVKMDAVPGRLNETWAEVTRAGVYYGQCSELCGSGHAYMPLMIQAVPESEYLEWLGESYERFAGLSEETETQRRLAAAEQGTE
ncbi:MAG: cytochrome c oxidase subunit II [Alphaproteobacteria bacterium]|nr:cytochrome c oxidase subunit II [Alphaproteobacteria bacterium]MDA8003622.1 cytochrome c oxidase subunit II [Alphaproteobacteria bacterium]MDA8005489.1 cytochrome c oxidase subunit II [Alphaproteobacteria bacterium]MDA8013206.1 cytochrome c oxidase subunit II [Alphaproteobacteria bacterium]